MKLKIREGAALPAALVLLLTISPPAYACGPFFPNSVLDRGDAGVLEAPRADFATTLEWLAPAKSPFAAHNTTDFAAEAAEADHDELARALRGRHTAADEAATIARHFEVERNKLTAFRLREDVAEADNGLPPIEMGASDPDPAPKPKEYPPITAPDPANLAGVPEEFADYLRGSVAWFSGEEEAARAEWEALLKLPAAERHYRSTWAAYMLGKSWRNDDPAASAGWFQKVRELRKAGFADVIGLAASSLGEEGAVALDGHNYAEAIRLYFEQFATGDSTAQASLAAVCRQVEGDDSADLDALARDEVARKVITAWLIQGDPDSFGPRWLDAVERARVTDMVSAEQLALASYQAGRWVNAQRWILRAPATPTTQWLRAKLLMRSGKTGEAAGILRRIAPLFPEDISGTNGKPEGLADALRMSGTSYTSDTITGRSQINAEAGALHLARREYTESLDALLQAGFWIDAAYVAERVLTPAELQAYVDRAWPAPPPAASDSTNSSSFDTAKEIRYLLARRLARGGWFDAARHYYPAEQIAAFDDLTTQLDAAAAAQGQARATALAAAAAMVRSNGMELVGTEITPDWHVFDGGFNYVFDLVERRRPANSIATTAGPDELRRYGDGPDPGRRYHYRYQAAALAWDAAQLMPDNTDEKARLLCNAGTWLKNRDPEAADPFYKELVRHCRKTAIGALADRMRWFPTLDEDGNPVPWEPEAPVETQAPADKPGYVYALNRGNTLEDVCTSVHASHDLTVTAEEIVQANPGLNVNRLKAGLTIFVPAPAAPAPEEIPAPAAEEVNQNQPVPDAVQ